jgi:hypothetical protein
VEVRDEDRLVLLEERGKRLLGDFDLGNFEPVWLDKAGLDEKRSGQNNDNDQDIVSFKRHSLDRVNRINRIFSFTPKKSQKILSILQKYFLAFQSFFYFYESCQSC